MERFSPGPLRPGGRWERMLVALMPGALTNNQLFAAQRSGEYGRSLDHQKFFRARGDLCRAGLIVRAGDEVWITAAGRAAVLALRDEAA